MAPNDDRISIEATGLSFSYGKRRVLHDVTLRVGPGEIVGLLGPNGSGKSTILKIVSGVLAGYSGCVRLAGRDVRDMSRRDIPRRLAMVPQESVFGFPFSVLEVVLMGRHPHLAGLAFESRADIKIAKDALARCDSLALASRSIQELSSGERQRVVFARALAQQPQILLLDEPASFLDIRHQIGIYDIVRDLALEQECTVLTALHDLNLASEYCDQVYLLSDGCMVAGGATSEILSYSNLTRVFNTKVYVDVNALTGKPLIVPLSNHPIATRKRLHFS